MGSRTALILASLVAVAAFGGWAIRQQHQGERLAGELAALRARHDQASRLQKEHQHLKDALEKLGDPAQIRQAYEQTSRLSGEVERLKLRARDLALATAPKDHPVEPIWPKDAPVLPAKEWKFSGSDNPRSTLESVLWAAKGGDVDRLAGLIDFRPGDRERADQFLATLPPESRAQYSSAENLVATLVAANMPTDYAAVAPYDEVGNSNQAYLKLRIEQASGQQQDLTFMFHHSDGGWRIDVPGRAIAGFERQLTSK